MFPFLVIAAGFAAYGPPSNYDAYEAFTARILVDVRETGDVLREPEIKQAPGFPSDLMLERCEPREHRAVHLRNGAVVRYNGYDCIMEVWPNANPPYRTTGFFRHNGFEWEYHGAIQAVDVPSPGKFSRDHDRGKMVTKPGSVAYDGDPDNPINDDYDPYKEILRDYEGDRDEF